MSKVVSGIGNAISGVVKGAVKAVSSVTSGVSDLAKSFTGSSFGKAIMMAAAIYFGGAALSGGFGAAEGTTFLEGMGTGVANAATSLSTAWGSAMSGNLSQAGSQVATGFGGEAAGAGASTGASTAVVNGGVQTQAQMLAAQNEGILGADKLTSDALKTGVKSLSVAPGFFSSDLAKYGTIMAGAQVAGGLISGAGQQRAMQDQRDYEALMAQQGRDRVNTNVGASLWGGGGGGAATPAVYQPTGLVSRNMPPIPAPMPTGGVAAYQPYQFDPMNYRKI